MNGGYIMIDCGGLELTSQTSQNIPGLFAAVKAAVKANKPIMAYNCEWEDDVMTPMNVMITPRSSGNYIATASTLQIEIEPNDDVNIYNLVS